LQLVKKIELPFKFIDIKNEILNVIENVGYKANQIMCQGLEENSSDWFTGVGRIGDLDDEDEEKYIHINPALKGTSLEKLINHYNCFRTRIMLMKPKSCYSVHQDPTPRIHLPIITNSQCWMIWPTHNQCFQMMPGDLYFTDTTNNHTFINGSDQDRIHIVFGIKDKLI
jgi:hypothetical protein